MKVKDALKILGIPNLEIQAWVKLNDDDGLLVQVSKAALRRELEAMDQEVETNFCLDATNTLYIG